MRGRPVNILLVDDQPANLLALEAVLADLDVNLVKALSGDEALRLLPDYEFAVVLLDVHMHGLDGFETARLIRGREESRHTPIIFLTAHETDRTTLEQAYSLGAVDYLIKPLVPVILRAKVVVFVELFLKTEEIKRQAERLRQVEREGFDQAVRQQREWFRVTLASIGDAVITTDTGGRVTFLNPVAEALTGWPLREAEGQALERVFPIHHEETRQPVEHPVAKVIQHGTVVGLGNHTALVARDGTERPIADSAAPIKDDGGRTLGVVMVFRDVTEGRRAEKALQDSEARKTAILQTALDCIITIDHEGKVVEFNPAAEKTFGYSRAEAVGRDLAELIVPPSLRERHHRGMAHYLATGEGPVLDKRIEITARRADGTEFPVELAITRISADGPPIFTGYLRDITERRRVEQRRNARLAVTQVLAQAATAAEAPPGILRALCEGLEWDVGALWAADAEARVLRCLEVWHRPSVRLEEFEAACRRLTLASGVGLPGRVWRSGSPAWVPDVTRDANFPRASVAVGAGLHGSFACPIRLGIDTPGAIEFFSHKVREPDADLLEMMATVGSQIGLFMERKGLEDQLRRRVEELAGANRHKDEFLAMLAHELRNPLAPIRNGLQIMRSSDADRQSVEKARTMMERQIGHMTRIVDDLLDVSRITRGKVVLRKERLDLGQIVRVVVEDEGPAFARAGLAVDLEIPELPVWVMGDSTRLTQVLENLLQNAIKFTNRGGRVVVGVRVGADDRQAILVVRDTGVGIEASMLPHLFETFAQADRSLDRSRGGLGLGLALVKGLVELHGGEVHALSAGPGTGAEFTVRLPLEPEPAALSGVPRAPNRTAERLRILVIEDNRDAADSLRVLLELYGHEVAVAYTGPEGVRAAERCQPHVVLCDIGLPGLDGYGVAGELRRKLATVKTRLIAVTGYGADDDRRRSREVGFDAHLVKPVDPDVLMGVLTPGPPASVPATAGGRSEPGPRTSSPSRDRPSRRVLVVDDNVDAAESLAMLLRLEGQDVRVAHDGPSALEAAPAYRPDVVFLDIGMPGLDGYEVCRRLRQQPGMRDVLVVALTGWGQEEDRRRSKEAGFDRHLVKPVDPAALEKLLAAPK